MAGGFPDSQLRAVFLFTPVLFTPVLCAPVLSATVVVPGMVRVKRFHLARYISLRFHKIIQVVDDLIGQANCLGKPLDRVLHPFISIGGDSAGHQWKLNQRNGLGSRSIQVGPESRPGAGVSRRDFNTLPNNDPASHRREMVRQ